VAVAAQAVLSGATDDRAVQGIVAKSRGQDFDCGGALSASQRLDRHGLEMLRVCLLQPLLSSTAPPAAGTKANSSAVPSRQHDS
jgi:hypothetical protein